MLPPLPGVSPSHPLASLRCSYTPCTFTWLNPIHHLPKAPSFKTAFLASGLHVTLLVIYSQILNSGTLWMSSRFSYSYRLNPVLPALQSRTRDSLKIWYPCQEAPAPETMLLCPGVSDAQSWSLTLILLISILHVRNLLLWQLWTC